MADTLRQLNAELKKRGVDRRLFRAREGYYYFDAPDWPASSVYVHHFSAFDVEGWVREFRELEDGAKRAGWINA